MPAYAIVDRSKRGPAAVLMILDDREEAESIAFELRRAHHDVVVVEIRSKDAAPPSSDDPQVDGA